jgi:hypothetical protein
MAPQVTAANVLNLEEHGEWLLQLYLEPLLAEDFQSGPVVEPERRLRAAFTGTSGKRWRPGGSRRQRGWRDEQARHRHRLRSRGAPRTPG